MLHIFQFLRSLVFIFCRDYSAINRSLIKKEVDGNVLGKERASDAVTIGIFGTRSNI